MPAIPFRATMPRYGLRALAAILLSGLVVSSCGEGPTVSAQPRELELSCPPGMVLIHATSFGSGPWHAPVLRGDPDFDPGAATPPHTAPDAKPTLIVVPGYCIDRQPFVPAGTAGQPLPAGVTREQAEAACRARGLRLCSPYEWELACRGKDLTRYAYGDRYDAACGLSTKIAATPASPAATAYRCQSSYGLYDQLGGEPEWVLGPLAKESLSSPAQMGGLLASEEPAGVDCLTLRLAPAAPAETGADAASGLAPLARIRCCGDPLAKSQYILNYDK